MAVLEAWDRLPERVRQAIAEMVEATAISSAETVDIS
jgi:hypothetical protein